MRKPTILIVEDEAIVAEDLSEKLERLGYETCGVTARGEDAVVFARELRPDLVLMDIRLEGRMDGVEAAEHIRREFDPPVIFLTSHSDRATVHRAKLVEPFGYILKPFEESELSTHIEMALYKSQTERKLREASEQRRLALEAADLGAWDYNLATGEVFWDKNCRNLFGVFTGDQIDYTAAIERIHAEDRAATDQAVKEAIAGVNNGAYHREFRVVWPDGSVHWVASHGRVYFEGSENNRKAARFIGVNSDITDRKNRENELHRLNQERDTTVQFLRLISESKGTADLIQTAITFFQQQSGCEAVGIRLKDGFDYPYAEARGFPASFVISEKSLCTRGSDGEVVSDSAGNPLLECMCGNVICGRFNPAKPFFTARGSFWTNSTTQLLATTSDSERQTRTRNRCHGEGYESVALIPLRFGETRLGLLQLNDRRPGVFSPEIIALWERLAEKLGVALAKFRAEDEVLRQREWLQVTLNSIGDAVIASDTAGRVVFLNPVAAAIAGWDPQEALGQPIQKIFPIVNEQTHQPAEDLVARTLREKRAIELSNHTALVTRQGAEVPIEHGAAPIMDSTGEVTGVVIVFRDVTEKRRAQETLLQSMERLKQLANGIPNLAWMADADGWTFWYNDRWYEYTGTTPQQMEGWGWQSVHNTHVLPQVLERWKASIATGQPFDMEFPLRGADGRFRPFLTRVLPLKDSHGRVVQWFGTNTEITSLVEAREVLARSREELERLVQERTVKLREAVGELEHFSYTITHDMRAPLRALRGFSELLLEEGHTSNGPSQMAMLEKIATSAERMDQLITDALNYSKLVRQDFPLAPVDIRALLKDLIDSYPNFQQMSDHIVVSGTMPQVLGNKAALTQCFSNLLSNAVKFVQPGSLPEILIWAEERGSSVRFWVKDNGIGIQPDSLEKVFGMFERLNHKYEGTGIGLALVKKAAERMGGKVGVESELGKGSRFWLEFKKA